MAREQFIAIEHLTDKEIEDIRAAIEREVNGAAGDRESAHRSLERLLQRH